MSARDKFWELLRESTLIQGLIAFVVTGAVVYLYLNQLVVPSELSSLLGLIIGFYFGGKVEQRLKGTLKTIHSKEEDQE